MLKILSDLQLVKERKRIMIKRNDQFVLSLKYIVNSYYFNKYTFILRSKKPNFIDVKIISFEKVHIDFINLSY